MNLFAQIEKMVTSTYHGWCTPQKAEVLASVIVAIRPQVVCEIGVWAGKSLIPMAMAVQYNKVGKVIAIDPWASGASIEGMSGENLKWWSSVDHDDIYNHFVSGLTTYAVSQVVDIRRAKSDDVEPPDSIGLLHIDGNHSDQAVKDVNRFAVKVVNGGFCFCDDVQWTGGGVSRATQALTDLGFKELYKLDTGALFQRIYE